MSIKSKNIKSGKIDTTNQPKPLSKYVITEYPDGFRLEAPDRDPIEVILLNYNLHLSWRAKNLELGGYGGVKSVRHTPAYNLFNFRKLLDDIVNGLLLNWQPLKLNPKYILQSDSEFKVVKPPPRRIIEQWAKKQTRRAIFGRVYQQWQRLLNTIEPNILATIKAVCVANFGNSDSGCEVWEELYQPEFARLVQDIQKYKAAAIACRYGVLLSKFQSNQSQTMPTGYYEYEPYMPDNGCQTAQERYPVLHQMNKDWKALFSPDNKTYRSLNRLLANLPGGVSGRLLINLNQLHLTRPITDRVELITLLLYAERLELRRLNLDIFLNARRPQILEALNRVATYTHFTLKPKTRDLHKFITILTDYPEKHHGNIVGLADKSVAWHRQIAHTNALRYLGELSLTQATYLPAQIALPQDERIQFLATVQDVLNEGEKMHHCIASYAREAVDGMAYLFHVEYKGEEASVMLVPGGQVVQSFGPCNHINNASRWAEKTLGDWGKCLPALPPPRPIGSHHNPFDNNFVFCDDGERDLDDIPF